MKFSVLAGDTFHGKFCVYNMLKSANTLSGGVPLPVGAILVSSRESEINFICDKEVNICHPNGWSKEIGGFITYGLLEDFGGSVQLQSFYSLNLTLLH